MTELATGTAGAAVVAATLVLLTLTMLLRTAGPATRRWARWTAGLAVPLVLVSFAVIAVRFVELSF